VGQIAASNISFRDVPQHNQLRALQGLFGQRKDQSEAETVSTLAETERIVVDPNVYNLVNR
jgi:hypothetical protein